MRLIRLPYALAHFLAASLLFVVQPMAARMVLPAFGGAPAVWTTSLLFFQTALLAGYALAHLLRPRSAIRLRLSVLAYLVILSLAVASPPFPLQAEAERLASSSHPALSLLQVLAQSLGLPVLALSATAPLLQSWYGRTAASDARDPYFFYVASNTGSLLALLAYPLVIESYIGLAQQAVYWSLGLIALVPLVFLCVPLSAAEPGSEARGADTGPSRKSFLAWTGLAAVPSSLLLGVTLFLSTDIAPVPLLWVIPLALYLVSYIAAFSRNPILGPDRWAALFRYALLALVPVLCAGWTWAIWIPLHLLVFFLASLAIHGRLAALRPPPEQLTTFYLAVALGGALGGVFNTLVAPFVFDRVTEYPLALVAACVAIPGAFHAIRGPRDLLRQALLPALILGSLGLVAADIGGLSESPLGIVLIVLGVGLAALVAFSSRSRPFRFALAVAAVLLASGLAEGVNGKILKRDRSFFGVLTVTKHVPTNSHRLFHGTTLHGQQDRHPDRLREPLTYFTRNGPFGQIAAELAEREPAASVAVVGLGVGTMAAYAEPNQKWIFYELDSAVIRLAEFAIYFSYLAKARVGGAQIQVIEGDARLRLTDNPDLQLDLLVLDAFGSDAPPIHLLTREAFRLYRRTLAPCGLIAVNLSNRFLDLDPVVAALAADAQLVGRVRYDLEIPRAERDAGTQPSIWAVLAANEQDLGKILDDPRWINFRLDPKMRPWTDDRANLLRTFLLGPRSGQTAGKPPL